MMFELDYGNCVLDSTMRRHTIQLAQDILVFCKGKVSRPIKTALKYVYCLPVNSVCQIWYDQKFLEDSKSVFMHCHWSWILRIHICAMNACLGVLGNLIV